MQFDFAAALVLASFVTGAIWALDVAVLSRRRNERGIPADRLPWYVDYAKSFFPVILLVLLLRSFVVEPFRIPSGSMMPTLLAGDFILVDKFSFGLRLPVLNLKILDSGQPERGDIAVFRYPEDPSLAYIKRIIGLPGDRIEYRNRQLTVNGTVMTIQRLPDTDPQAEPGLQLYEEQFGPLRHRILTRSGTDGFAPWKFEVPAGHYFVMGDNRDNSRDSRYWGALPEENLIGRAFLIWMNMDCLTGKGRCNRIGTTIE